MPSFYGPVDLIKNELRNAVVQNLGAAPASPLKGQLYFDSTANVLYWYNGTAWIGASGATPASTVTTQAIGDSPVVGTLITFAREDHKHGEPPWTGVVTSDTVFGAAASLGSSVNPARGDHSHGSPALGTTTIGNNSPGTASAPGTQTTAAHSDHVHGWSSAVSSLDMGGNFIINVSDPVSPQHASTKNYVDNAIAGLAWKAPVRVASPAATNFGTMSGLIPIDGVTPNAGDRILLKSQSTPSNNGIWIAAAGAWTRSTDAATGAELLNAAVYVEEGTTQADTGWVCTTNAPITIGTTALTFVQFTGAGTYTNGNGLTLTGNVFAVGAGTGILSTPGQVAMDPSVLATHTDVTNATVGMARKASGTLAGTASPEVITHNLGTRSVQVTVVNGASPYNAVEVDWQATTTSTVTIIYNPALGAGYNWIVVG